MKKSGKGKHIRELKRQEHRARIKKYKLYLAKKDKREKMERKRHPSIAHSVVKSQTNTDATVLDKKAWGRTESPGIIETQNES